MTDEHGMLADMADEIYLQEPLTHAQVDAEELGAWREAETIKRLGYCVCAGAALDDVTWLAAELGLADEWAAYQRGQFS